MVLSRVNHTLAVMRSCDVANDGFALFAFVNVIFGPFQIVAACAAPSANGASTIKTKSAALDAAELPFLPASKDTAERRAARKMSAKDLQTRVSVFIWVTGLCGKAHI